MRNAVILLMVFLVVVVVVIRNSNSKVELARLLYEKSPDKVYSSPVVIMKDGTTNSVYPDLGFDPTSQESMSKYWDERLEANETHVTNTYILGTNSTTVRVTSWRRNKHWGTDGWEVYSKIMFQEGCEMDTGQSQVIDVIMQYPGARDSDRLFTGAYASTFVLKLIQEHVRLANDADIRFEEAMKSSWIIDEKEPATREVLIQLEMEMHRESVAKHRDAINDLKARHLNAMKELYGGFPKDIFQQLMALEYKLMF